jgi:hypothetical protein
VLKTLQFDLDYNSVETFVQHFLSKLQLSEESKKNIQLLADVSLFYTPMYEFTPSELSLGIIYSILNRNKLDRKIEKSLR